MTRKRNSALDATLMMRPPKTTQFQKRILECQLPTPESAYVVHAAYLAYRRQVAALSVADDRIGRHDCPIGRMTKPVDPNGNGAAPKGRRRIGKSVERTRFAIRGRP